jgi:tol-pal system protein YbgF
MRPGRPDRIRLAAIAGVLGASLVMVPAASAAASVQERLDSIERKLDARGLIDMLNRIEQLQQDLQKLRGQVEVQAHTLEEMQRRQREQYLDIDRRLQQLESAQVPVSGTVVPGANGAAPAVAPPVTAAPPAVSGAAPVSSADPAREQAEYDTALAILRDGRYSDAALAFKQFIDAYPNGSYTDNAYYWLGETYYVTREFDKAQATFSKLTTDFPDSQKAADSRLKLGYIYYEKKDWKAARAELEAVAGNWPASTAARLANERLARMKKEGH